MNCGACWVGSLRVWLVGVCGHRSSGPLASTPEMYNTGQEIHSIFQEEDRREEKKMKKDMKFGMCQNGKCDHEGLN